MSSTPQRVAILGASDKADRYSNKAFRLLRKHGHEVVPVNRGLAEIEGVPVLTDIADVTGKIDTLTMYVGPAISSALGEKITTLKPGRVIFNPGSENPALEAELTAASIPWEHACTLVLLNTEQF